MAQIGTVKEINGAVQVVGTDGVSRVLVLGDPIFEGDVVTTLGSTSSVKLSFDSGRELTLNGEEKSLMEESIYAKEGFENTDITAEQQALLDGGALPEEATALGDDGPAADGGITEAFVGANSDALGDVNTYNLGTDGLAGAGAPAANPDIINQSPEASDDVGETFEEGKGTGDEYEAAIVATGNVLANDVDDGLGSLGGDLDVSAVASNNLGNDGSYSAGSFTLVGEFGTLVIDEKSGEYTYTVDDTNATVDALNVGDTLLEDFTYTVTDGDLTDTASLSITINGTNDAPIAEIDTATTDENVTLNIQILENDSDVDSDSFDLVSINTEGLNGVATIAADGISVDYNPGEFYDFLAVGEEATDTFTYTIIDNEGDNSKSTTQTVVVTLTGTNDQPIVSAVILDPVNEVLDGLNENEFTAQLLVDDVDGTDTHDFFVSGAGEDNAPVAAVVADNSGVNLGISATVEMIDTATGTFRVVGDFNALAVGEEATVTFEYYAVDSARDADSNAFDGTDGINETSTSEAQTVTVTIIGTNDQPQILDVSVSQAEVIEGLNTFSGSLEETDLDVTDEHTFEMVAGSVVADGFEGEYNNGALSVSVNPNGTYSVTGDFNTLALGESTTVSFQYRANDQNGFDGTDGINQNSLSDIKTVTLTITGTNDAPVAVADFAGFGGQTAVNLTETHTIDASENTIGYSYFEVLGSGTTVTIHTDGPTIDPVMYLIRNDGNITSDDIISYNDDGHTLAGAFRNSIISETLEPGSYIAVVSDYALSESELIAGFNNLNDSFGGILTGDVTLTFNSSSSIILGDTNGEVIYENDTFTLDVLANDTDVDHGATFTLDSLSNQTGNGQFTISADNKLVFTPGTEFDHLAVGDTETISIEYTMSDEHGAESSALATLQITGTNDTPLVIEVTVTPMISEVLDGDNENTFTGELVVNDVDDGDTHAFYVLGANSSNDPIEATVTDDSGVALGIAATVKMTDTDAGTFEIVGDFNALADGEEATVTFQYYAVDDNNLVGNSVHQTSTSLPQTVTVTILGTNDAPIIADVTLVDTPEADTGLNVFSGNLVETDLDVTDTHEFFLVGSSDSSMDEYDASLSVTVNLDGSYTLSGDFNTLKVGESTVVTFDYKAVDDSGTANNTSTTETVSVTITGTNDGPIAVADGGLSGTLAGNYYGSDAEISGIVDAQAIAAGENADATFTATRIDYELGSGNLGYGTNLQNFLDHDASSLDDDPVDNNRQSVIVLEGDLAFAEGDYVFKVHSDDGYQILIDGVVAGEFTGNRGPGTNTNPSIHIDGGEHHVEIIYWDQGGQYVLNVEYSFEGEPFVTLNTNAIMTYENDAITIDVLANDTDIDHDASFTLVSVDELGVDAADEHVSIVGNELVFTPGTTDFDYLAVGESTQVVISYVMSDEHGATSSATATLTIIGTNDKPEISNIDINHNISTITFVNDNAGYNNVLGVYQLDEDGNPINPEYILLSSDNATLGDLLGTFNFTSPELQYFLLPNGANSVDAGDILAFNENGQLTVNGNLVSVIYSEDTRNPNSEDQMEVEVQADGSIQVYFDDQLSNGDQDYNDLVVNSSGVLYESHDNEDMPNDDDTKADGDTLFTGSLITASAVNDADTSDTHEYIMDGTASAKSEDIDDDLMSVEVTVNTDGTFDVVGDFNALAAGETAIVTFDYYVEDSALGGLYDGLDGINESSTSDIKTATLTITGTNDQPVIENVHVGNVLVAEDFETGATGWSSNTTENGGELTSFLGRFGGTANPVDTDQEVSKTFDLGAEYAGKTVTVSFDMYEIDSWDGDSGWNGESPAEAFQTFVNGSLVSSDIMKHSVIEANQTNTIQAFNPSWSDGIHHYSITATVQDDGTLDLGFGSTLHQDISDESWGIDNLQIVAGQTIYEADSGENTFNGTLHVSDDDVTDAHIYQISNVSVDNANVTGLQVNLINSSTGEYTMSGDFNALAAGEIATVTFEYRADDQNGFNGTDGINENSLSEPKTVTLTVTGTNDLPEVSDHLEALVDGSASISLESYDDAGLDGGAKDIEDDLDTSKVTQIKIETKPDFGILTVDGTEVEVGDVFAETVSFDYEADYGDVPFLFGTKDDAGDSSEWGTFEADGTVTLSAGDVTGTISGTNDIGYQSGGIGTHDGTGIGIVGSTDDSQIELTGAESMTITFDEAVANAEVGFSSVGGNFVEGTTQDATANWTAYLGNDIVTSGTERQVGSDDGNPNTVVINIDVPFDTIVFTVDGNINSNYSIQYVEVNPVFSDSFTYSAIDSDGGISVDSATVTLTGSATNFTPDASNDSLTTDEGTPLVINPATLLANDIDSNGDTLTITHVDSANHGTVELNQDGTITFTPDANYSGPASFNYAITDGNGEIDTAIVNLIINPVADAPTLMMSVGNETITLGENLIVNGSFEDLGKVDGDGNPILGELTGTSLVSVASIPGWNLLVTDGSMPNMEPHASGHASVGTTDGNHYMDLGASPGNSAIVQNVAGLTDGNTYQLSFDFRDKAAMQEAGQAGKDSGIMQVLWNGEVVALIQGDNVDDWDSISVKVTADATLGNELIFNEIGVNDDNWGIAIDNVQLHNMTYTYDLTVNASLHDTSETLGDVLIDTNTLPVGATISDSSIDVVSGIDSQAVLTVNHAISLDEINAITGSVTSTEVGNGDSTATIATALIEIEADDNGDFTGTSGNDVLYGGIGSDDLSGGLGNDTLIYDAADSNIDGGAGIDTLALGSGDMSLDLTNVHNIEILSLDSTTITSDLSAADVFGATEADVDGNHELTITGDVASIVNLDSGDWVANGTDINGNNVYESTGADNVTLKIDVDITTVI